MRVALTVMALVCVLVNCVHAAETGLKTDIEFAKVGDVSLTLDASVPEGNGPFPTCILVHGGGFIRGDKQVYIKPLFEPLTRAGFTWFTINYRLAPQHRWPACADDVETAVRWVKDHAREYKVDLSRVALIGESAGGHLVSYVGAKMSHDGILACVVPFYAPHDLELQVRHRNMLSESMTGLLGVTELNDETWKRLREASPSNYVTKGMLPYLQLHGDKDTVVPLEQSSKFKQQMENLGNVCDLITVHEGAHGMGGWDKLTPDYRDQLVTWLKTTMTPSDETSAFERLTELGGQVSLSDGHVSKVFFKDCSRLGPAEFRLIGRLKELKSLTLYGQCKGLNDETLPYLSGLAKLEELSTDAMQVTDEGLKGLTALTNVRSMSFFHPSFGMKGFDGHGFAALKTMPKLERLTVAGTPFDDRGMAAVAEITQLRDFRTWHTYQSPEGNNSLTKLSHLRSLWLGQRLRRYDGGSNHVTLDDSTIDVLTQLKGLESLTLDEAKLSLTGLRRLTELPQLKKLELRRIDIPADDVENLRKALPAVAIDWKPLTDEERTKLVDYLKN